MSSMACAWTLPTSTRRAPRARSTQIWYCIRADMSVRSALLLAALVFLLTLLVRLPASVLLTHLPGSVRCTDVSGTLWRGSCGELAFGPQSVSDVRWTLHPVALLRARIALDLASADPAATGQT